MVNSIGNNLTALKAFGTKMEVTAKNIANVNSEEYKKSRATIKEGPNSGVQADVEHINTSGPSIGTVDGDQATRKGPSNVDLTEEMSEMIITKHGYSANLQAVKTQDEMLGAALDILG
jgi:flagellar basal-body rod protein FlgC